MRASRVMVGSLVLLAACRGGGGGEPPSRPAHAPAEEPARESTPNASFVAVRRPSDRALLEAPGRALSGEGSLEQIAATYPLRVVRVHAQAGDVVEAGAAIVEVTSAEVLGAAANHRAATESLAVVTARLEAVRALARERAATAEQVYELEARAAELRGLQRTSLATLRAAGLDASSASRALARGSIVLETKHGGVVREMHGTPGEVHLDGQRFATIVSGPSRRVEARFPRALGDGFRFEFEDLLGTHHALGDRPTRTLEAGEGGAVLFWFDLPADATLQPDAPGHVHAIPTRESLVEVPLGALHPTESGAEVLRRRADATDRVPVRVVASSGSTAVVEGDLRVGDEVASDASGVLDAPAEGH